jgi:hypothetical protein
MERMSTVITLLFRETTQHSQANQHAPDADENGDLQTHHQYPSASSLDDLSLTNAEFTVHTRSYNQLAPERHDEALSQVGIGTVNSGHTSQLALETRWYPKKGSVSLA